METSCAFFSVNHMLPSGPAAIRSGWLAEVGTQNSWIVTPDPVTDAFATLFALISVTQTVPPGPAATSVGQLPAVGSTNWAIVGPLDAAATTSKSGSAAAGCQLTINASSIPADAPRATPIMVLTHSSAGPGRADTTGGRRRTGDAVVRALQSSVSRAPGGPPETEVTSGMALVPELNIAGWRTLSWRSLVSNRSQGLLAAPGRRMDRGGVGQGNGR